MKAARWCLLTLPSAAVRKSARVPGGDHPECRFVLVATVVYAEAPVCAAESPCESSGHGIMVVNSIIFRAKTMTEQGKGVPTNHA